MQIVKETWWTVIRFFCCNRCIRCSFRCRGDPPQGKLLHLSPEFQRCLLAPREMDFELKNFRLSAPPLPNLKCNVLEPIEVELSVSVETESWSAIPPKRRSSCILSSTCHLPGFAEIPEFETKGLSFHIENNDGSSLAK